MQLHQLRYLLALSEQRNFSRAAETLHLSQPSVSAAISSLERELGTELFYRSRGEVALTAAGEAFLPWARQVLADCEAGRTAVHELLGLRGGRVALGATPSLTTHLLPPVLAEFHRQYPRVRLSVYEAGSQDLVERLDQALLDAALVILPVRAASLTTTVLLEEELVLAVSDGHCLAGKGPLRLEQLEGVPLVMFREGYDLRDTTVSRCRDAGFEPTLAMEAGEMDGVLALAAAGIGACLVPASVIDPGGPLQGLAFAGARLSRTVGIASRRDRRSSPAASTLVELICRRLRDSRPLTDRRG